MRGLFFLRLGAVTLVALGACARSEAEQKHAAQASASATPSAPASPSTSAVIEKPVITLPVEGFGDAVVSIPDGWREAKAPIPVVVAAHGYDDRPEGQCDVWRWTVKNRAFVLCPRGVPTVGTQYKGFSYPGPAALAKEVDAGLVALGKRYEGKIELERVIYAGFSLGANLAGAVVLANPARFSRVVLGEGGSSVFLGNNAAAFAKKGGTCVLFSCGLTGCVASAKVAAAQLTKAGVRSEVVLGKLPGKTEFMHWYNGPVADEVAAKRDWLFDECK